MVGIKISYFFITFISQSIILKNLARKLYIGRYNCKENKVITFYGSDIVFSLVLDGF